MKKFAVSALAVAALAGSAMAQGGATNDVQLQLRLVPQHGVLDTTTGIIDDAAPTAFTAAGQVQRYEVQFRLVDLNTGDAFFPAGLTSGNLRITITGGANSTLSRALLSRFEAQQAASTPPSSPDLSGPPTGAFAGATGMHKPYRGGIPSPAPNNDNPANGIFNASNSEISGITPLALSQSDQNVADAWYGLYSFDITAGSGLGSGAITITAGFDADAGTGNRFGFFNDGDPVPVTSQNAQGATANLPFNIPAPGTLALLGLGGLVAGRRRR